MLESGLLGQELLWGVRAWQLALALFLFIISFFAKTLVTGFFNGWLKKRAAKTAVQWDDDLVELAPSPLTQAIRILLWYGAALTLSLPQAPANVRLWVLQGLEIALWVSVIWLLFRLIDVFSRVMERMATRTETKLDDQLAPMARKALKVFVAVILVVMFVQNLGIEVGSLLASVGIGGLALALAAKDTVGNFFGSILIFADQPFQIGDIIEVGGNEGVVEEVGFRTTLIRKFDKSLLIVPNQTFTSSPVTNSTRRPRRRIKVTVGLTYDTTSDQMREFTAAVNKMLADHDGLDHEFHTAVFNEFGDSSLNVLVVAFSKNNDWVEMATAQEKLMLRIMDIVADQGLEIAFPTRTVHVVGEA
ncbi:MAG: mechanosensitive ion channel family protein [Rhodothermales bacterium]